MRGLRQDHAATSVAEQVGPVTKRRILCFLHLPPPVNGVSLMGEVLAGSHLLAEEFLVDILPLRSSRSTDDLGRFRPGKVLAILATGARLAAFCVLRRPEFVYFTITPNGKAFYRDLLYVAVMRCLGVHRVYHLHGKGIRAMTKGRLSRRLFEWAFSGATVILLSPLLFDDISHLVDRANCRFLPNGIPDIDAIVRQNENTDTGRKSRILFFSNMMKSKGPLVLLAALASLHYSGAEFKAIFAGEWESHATETEFWALVRENRLAEVVEYVGPRYGREKEEIFADADIFAFPTMNDSFPLVVLEAMRQGLPVVATVEGAIPEIVDDGTTGFLVLRGDHKALAGSLERLICDRELRRRMGQAGRDRFLSRFTVETFERNVLGIFTNVLVAESQDDRPVTRLEA